MAIDDPAALRYAATVVDATGLREMIDLGPAEHLDTMGNKAMGPSRQNANDSVMGRWSRPSVVAQNAWQMLRYGTSTARTVVLVHGLTEAGMTWPDLVGHWGADWYVLAPDLRGHGQSPRFTEDGLATAPEVLLADVLTVLGAQPEPFAIVGHFAGCSPGAAGCCCPAGQGLGARARGPSPADRGRTPDRGFVAEFEDFLDAMADQGGQVARMLRVQFLEQGRDRSQAWATCKPLVDCAYVRRGLYLGDGAWEELFGALRVPTLLLMPPDSPMAPL
jgi:pimeloyl-ACP methyl ester carboxylesterase